MKAAPADDELAAIALALASLRSAPKEMPPPKRCSAWTTAARNPDLEFDDLHAFVRRPNEPCSTSF